MSVTRHVFKEFTFACAHCDAKLRKLAWSYEAPPFCACGQPMEYDLFTPGDAPNVIGDECDITVRHGACNPDGSPRRYRSKHELKEASRAAGWTAHGDTPLPPRGMSIGEMK